MQKESFATSIVSLFMKIFAGIAGGLLGTSTALLVMVGMIYSTQTSGNSLHSAEFSGVSLVVLIFVAAFVGNMSALYFLTLVDKKKYRYKNYILKGAFFLNIFLFLVALPFYVFLPQGDFLLTIAGIHLFLSATNSALFAEIFSGVKYAVSGVIGISIAQMIFLLSYIGIGAPSSNTIITILFLPFIWMLIPFFLFVVEKLYGIFQEKLAE